MFSELPLRMMQNPDQKFDCKGRRNRSQPWSGHRTCSKCGWMLTAENHYELVIIHLVYISSNITHNATRKLRRLAQQHHCRNNSPIYAFHLHHLLAYQQMKN